MSTFFILFFPITCNMHLSAQHNEKNNIKISQNDFYKSLYYFFQSITSELNHIIYHTYTICVFADADKQGRKGKKQAKVEQAQQKSRGRSQKCQAWFSSNRVDKIEGLHCEFGLVRIPVQWTRHPDGTVADRKEDQDHVLRVETSMITHGIMKTDIVILIWKEDLVALGLDPENIVFALSPTGDVLPNCPVDLHVIAGDHTCTASRNLHVKHPRNKLFQYIEAAVVVSEKNADTIKLAKLYGGLDNKIKHTHKKKSVWEYVTEMHTHFSGAAYANMSKEEKEGWMADMYLKCASPKNSVDSWKVVSQTTGDLWTNINTIMTGETRDRKAVPPKNTSFFNNMSKIPQEVLVRWSKKVVDGEEKPRDFQQRCLVYKKKVLAQNKFLTYANTLVTDEADVVHNYNDLCKKYPFFGEADWFMTRVGWMSDKVKDDLSSNIKQSIRDRIASQKAKESNQPVTHGVYGIIVEYCRIHNVVGIT